MDEYNRNVQIPIGLEEYKRLIETANEYDILLNALLSNAKLTYSEDELSFSDNTISCVLKAIAPNDYDIVFKKLKKEKENKNESVD